MEWEGRGKQGKARESKGKQDVRTSRVRFRTTGLLVFPGIYGANAGRDLSRWDLEIASNPPPTAS